MQLIKLSIRNFRQFKDTQHLEFAVPTGQHNENVTIIFGENGRGKTGIFRAILFCLYGDQQLSQDEDVDQKELYLVNSPAIEESEGEPVEAFVELEFSHSSEIYTIRRTRRGLISGGQRIEEPGKVQLSVRRKGGNTDNKYDPAEINQEINGILDRSVREYFLFDGEKIQRLTLASPQQRREIARGIKNILNVDSLERSIRATEKLTKTFNIELARKASGEYQQVISQINEHQDNLGRLQEQQSQLEKELGHAESQKTKVDKHFEEHKEIIGLVKQRSEAEDRRKGMDDQREGLLQDMKTRTGRTALLLVSGTVDNVFSAIDERKQKGEIPSEIRKDLIERLLNDGLCICGRDLTRGTEPFRKVIAWKNKMADAAVDSSALEVWRSLSGIRDQKDDIRMATESLLQRYAQCTSEIESLQRKIEDLGEKIGTSERQDVAALQRERSRLEKEITKISAAIMKTNGDISTCKDELEQLRERRKGLEKEQKIKDELSQRANLAEETHRALEVIHKEFTDEIKQRITTEANHYLSMLLDEEGRATIRQLIVNEDYSLQVLDKWGKRFLANISAGQRQIMSISFIAALAKVASASAMLEMPLFMDTPFGRLSMEHRRNLVEKLPDLCAQWVLLATDTEFTKQEATLLLHGGRWGKFYELQAQGPGISTIRERPIEDVMAILADRSEELHEFVR